jgi:hypothetical protein
MGAALESATSTKDSDAESGTAGAAKRDRGLLDEAVSVVHLGFELNRHSPYPYSSTTTAT